MQNEDLTRKEKSDAFKIILDHKLGNANDVSIGAFFGALQTKRPTTGEISELIDVVLNYRGEILILIQ